jgi:rod shape-determining protein MreB
MFNFASLFTYDIGIDPGSYKTRAVLSGNESIYDDFTFVTYSALTKSAIAYGDESKEMVGRVPKGMEVHRPLQNTEIVTNVFYEMYLRNLFEGFSKNNSTFKFKTKPKVYILLPIDHTQASLKNFESSVIKSGASEVVFLKKPVVAAHGIANTSTKERIKLIIDIGYQKTEISTIYKNEVHESKIIDFGGETIDKVILNKLIDEKRIQCSMNNIEKYKEECLVFQPFVMENEKFKVVGKDIKKGIPITTEVSFLELRDMVLPLIRTEFLKQLKVFLNTLNDRILGDLFEEGVYLIGGTAKNKSLAKLLSKELGIRFNIVKNPDLVSVKGLKNIMTNSELVEKIRIKADR